MRQCLNKVLQRFVYFFSVTSVLLGDGGGPSDSSSKFPYGENVFLGIATDSVYFLTVALTLTAAYLLHFYLI